MTLPNHIGTGTTEHRQQFTRAHYPDGRIKDSEPKAADPDARWAAVEATVEAFGRMSFPHGTRFERLERTITVTASPWEVVTGRSPAQTTPATGRRGGPWTSHGHAIDGVTVDGPDRPDLLAKCGGPTICSTCATEAEQFRSKAAS